MSTFYNTFLSKSDFSFVLLQITFEPLEIEQSYVPLLKALMCDINAVGAQECSCVSTFCHMVLATWADFNPILAQNWSDSTPDNTFSPVFAHLGPCPLKFY